MKSGFVAIVGRPSTGKSTLLNVLCGEKVAITSRTPQTTRVPIRGIVNQKDCQIVFLDTPGYHHSGKKFNHRLLDMVQKSVKQADLCLYLTDAGRLPGTEENMVMNMLAESKKSIIAAVNKIDIGLKMLPEIRGAILLNLKPLALLNISALKQQGLAPLMENIAEHCPEGPALYPAEIYTDQSPGFRISEIIREKALGIARNELPHSIYVEIADLEFRHSQPENNNSAAYSPTPSINTSLPTDFSGENTATNTSGKLWVRAFIVVESSSQASIMVGSKGRQIAIIRKESLKEIHAIFTWKVQLDLRVKVNRRWRRKDEVLEKMFR